MDEKRRNLLTQSQYIPCWLCGTVYPTNRLYQSYHRELIDGMTYTYNIIYYNPNEDESGVFKSDIKPSYSEWAYTFSESYNEPQPTELTITSCDVKPTRLSYLFDASTSFTKLDLNGIDTSECTYFYGLFCGCNNLEELHIDKWDLSKCETLGLFFYSTIGVKIKYLKMPSKTSHNLTYVQGLFQNLYYCYKIDGIETWDVSNVRSFYNFCAFTASKATKEEQAQFKLDLRGWDVSNAISMQSMFHGSKISELNISGWKTSNCTNFHNTFIACENLTHLDVSSFDTSKATTLRGMFSTCTNLEELYLLNFDTANNTTFYRMFTNCSSITELDLSSFSTAKATDFTLMFSGMSKLKKLNLLNFNGGKASKIDNMFSGCNALETIITNSKFRDWCVTNAEKISLPSKFRDINYDGWEIIE